ncbi:MAG TPA: hypothetical protein VFD32_04265 [Dehalococcoidia bacterium]|nr:hypothetical protein [Dehalococcoidia bacterium]
MLVELLSVRTDDGCLLDAAYWPASGAAAALAEACVLIHGAGGNGFSPTQRALAEGLAQAGLAVLTLSTRGHDLVSRTAHPSGPRLGGVAFEDLDEAPLDLAAGVRLLAERGHRRIGLAGHSLGAVKAVLTAAGSEPACLIALSPPRFAHAALLAAANGARFRTDFAAARRLADAGQAEALMRVQAPIPSLFAAGQYVKKYGPEDRYDVVRLLPAVRCPALLLFGSLEAHDGGAVSATAAAAPDLAARCENLSVVEIAGADHVYTDRIPQVVEAICAWLRGASAMPAPGGGQPASAVHLGGGAPG